MSYQLVDEVHPADSSHRWYRFRQPSGSHGAFHPRLEEQSPSRLLDERKELIGSVLVSAAQSLDAVVPD
jgi:hypothetical protein